MTKVAFQNGIAFLLWIAACAGGYYYLDTHDPFAANVWQFIVFYLLIFVWVATLAMIVGFAVRRLLLEEVPQQFLVSVRRQGLLLGLMAVVVLLLQAQAVLTLVTGGAVLLIFTLTEFYLQ